VAAAACGEPPDPPPARPADAPVPASVTAADLQRLRWLEGHWRGTGESGNPFYESYRFLNDSTIQSHTFTDSTFAQAGDSSLIMLSGGELTSRGGGMEWVATEIDSAGVHFDPRENARNAFTWSRDSPTRWTALLRWVDADGASREMLYRMERVGDEADFSAPIVLFVSPDSAEIDRLQRTRGEDFYVAADDAMWYRAAAYEFLDSVGIPHVEARRDSARFLVDGRPRVVAWDDVDRTWFAIVYDGRGAPAIAADVDIREAVAAVTAAADR
jgi:hypothetical protein